MGAVITDDVNLDEEQPQPPSFLTNVMDGAYSIAVNASTTSFGQSLLKQSDKVLWITEKTARWICPPEAYDVKKSQSKSASVPLVRPLPWLLFLPALLWMRCARISISVTSQLIGYEAVEAADLITYLQSYRRKIRALKFQGQRVLRSRSVRKFNGHNNKNRNDGVFQAVCSSIARALSCQTPDVFEQMQELLAHQKKNTKCSLNETTEANENTKNQRNGHNEVDDLDSDSSEISERLQALLENTYADDSDSDEDYRAKSSEEEENDHYFSNGSSSGMETEIHMINGSTSKGPKSPEKSHENGAVHPEEENTPKAHNGSEKDPVNNGTVNDVHVENEATNKPNSEGKSDHLDESNSSATTGTRSPASAENSRDSSKENLSVPISSGGRGRSHRQSNNYNRTKINRNPKKFNGDQHRQSSENLAGNAQTTAPNRHNSHNGPKTVKRPQF